MTSDEQRFLSLVRLNPTNEQLLQRLPALGLRDCYLVAGCLFQTVWNCLSGKRPAEDIVDYDVFYHDPGDVRWEAEDAIIRRVLAAVGDLGVEVQVRNQARVHLWYEQKFGVACPPLRSSRDGIDHFLNQSSCFGIRCEAGVTEVYAPYGFEDLFAMIVRPNCRRSLPAVYYPNARRWSEAWPRLQVIEWPGAPPSEDLVHFAPETEFRDAIATRFRDVETRVKSLVPGADVQHVGSTAIPGSLTKGDLDVQVRVPASSYAEAKRRLAQLYRINGGGFVAADAASFEDYSTTPSLGVHLTVIGGSADIQFQFRDRLLASAELREQYDLLKRQFEGRSMERYRDAKAAFVSRVLLGPQP